MSARTESIRIIASSKINKGQPVRLGGEISKNTQFKGAGEAAVMPQP